jgi:pimeloyl-ACP methyl ester carboxylesterase
VKKYTLAIADLDIEIVDSQGMGEPIFLLHGNSSSAQSFDAFFQSDLIADYRLLAINLPGHAGSSVMRDVSIPLLSNLLCEIIGSFAFSRYLLIGHSVGGHIFSHALSRLPGCRGLILISAPPLSLETISLAFKPDPTNGALFTDVLDSEQVNTMAKALLGSGTTDVQVKLLEESIKLTSGSFRKLLGESLMAGQLHDEYNCLLEANVPVAMIWGEQDLFIDSSFYQNVKLNRYLGKGFYTLTGSGHSPHIDNAKRCVEIIAGLAALKMPQPAIV